MEAAPQSARGADIRMATLHMSHAVNHVVNDLKRLGIDADGSKLQQRSINTALQTLTRHLATLEQGGQADLTPVLEQIRTGATELATKSDHVDADEVLKKHIDYMRENLSIIQLPPATKEEVHVPEYSSKLTSQSLDVSRRLTKIADLLEANDLPSLADKFKQHRGAMVTGYLGLVAAMDAHEAHPSAETRAELETHMRRLLQYFRTEITPLIAQFPSDHEITPVITHRINLIQRSLEDSEIAVRLTNRSSKEAEMLAKENLVETITVHNALPLSQRFFLENARRGQKLMEFISQKQQGILPDKSFESIATSYRQQFNPITRAPKDSYISISMYPQTDPIAHHNIRYTDDGQTLGVSQSYKGGTQVDGSDALWLSYRVGSDGLSGQRPLRYIQRSTITNDETLLTLWRCKGGHDVLCKGQTLTLTPQDGLDFYAMLATPNCRSAAYLIKDHGHDLGISSIRSITINPGASSIIIEFNPGPHHPDMTVSSGIRALYRTPDPTPSISSHSVTTVHGGGEQSGEVASVPLTPPPLLSQMAPPPLLSQMQMPPPPLLSQRMGVTPPTDPSKDT